MKRFLSALLLACALASSPVHAGTLVSLTSGFDATPVTEISVPKQGNAGQLLIVGVMVDGVLNQGEFFFQDPGTISAPVGFTQIDNTAFGTLQSRFALFKKTLSSVEPTNYLFMWSLSSTDQWVAIVENATVDGAITLNESDGNMSNSTTFVAPSVSPGGAADTLLSIWGVEGGDPAISVQVGMTVRLNSDQNGSTLIVADQPLTKSGPTGTRTATSANSNGAAPFESSRAASFALHP